MKMMPFTNTKDHAVHIGNKTIMPNSTREVEATLHPDYKPPKKVAEPAVDIVAEIQAKKASEIPAELPNLDDAQLIALYQLEEESEKSRKTVKDAIAKLQLERAAASSVMEQFADGLSNEDDATLAELAELHKDNEQLLALVQAEQEKRAKAE
jgi:hypothetical protein